MAALPDEAARTDLYGGCSVISIPTAIVQSYAILPIGWPMGRFGPLGRGLLVSQLLTLYTTPVIYLYLDRLRLWTRRPWPIRQPQLADEGLPEPGE